MNKSKKNQIETEMLLSLTTKSIDKMSKRDPKKGRQMLKLKRQLIEANARRRVNRKWEVIEHGNRYKVAQSRKACRLTTLQLEEELFDGHIMRLDNRNQDKSYPAQKRIMRRIVEKRQAQQVHKNFGRTESRHGAHMESYCISHSLQQLYRWQMCC